MRALLVFCGLVVSVAGCDRLESFGRSISRDDPRLTLSVEPPGVLDWGEGARIRLTVGNEGSTPARDVRVELYLPPWLEFSAVEPAGTEVAMMSSGQETRLSYLVGEPPLEPGETRTVVQRVRVAPGPGVAPGPSAPGPGSPADTAAPARPGSAPADRVIRARLITPGGEVLGVEVRAVLAFRGAEEPGELPGGGTSDGVGGTRVSGEGVGPVRLGMTVEQLRRAAPTARDTTFTLGEGIPERGMTVPIASGHAVTALLVDARIDRVIVGESGVVTDRGVGVGSTLEALREAYGEACVAAAEDGRAVVWFPAAPGISFGLDARAPPPATGSQRPRDELLPGSATVRALWVRRGVDTC